LVIRNAQAQRTAQFVCGHLAQCRIQHPRDIGRHRHQPFARPRQDNTPAMTLEKWLTQDVLEFSDLKARRGLRP